MDLCVGAVTRNVIEVAAELRVPQIVASRRQVDVGGGYTGLDQDDLVKLVRDLSGGATKVVRDHGGPLQAGDPKLDVNALKDAVLSFDADVAAGFDALHLDVSLLPRGAEQEGALMTLLERYAPKIDVEIGGEHDDQDWLNELLDTTRAEGVAPAYAVMDVGGYIHADRQCGFLRDYEWVTEQAHYYHSNVWKVKVHNMDWLGRRSRFALCGVDAYNVAPEFANVEVDAWLQVLSHVDREALLSYAYDSERWRRWFDEDEGTRFERARCAFRYVMNDGPVAATLAEYGDEVEFVRERIRDAIQRR